MKTIKKILTATGFVLVSIVLMIAITGTAIILTLAHLITHI